MGYVKNQAVRRSPRKLKPGDEGAPSPKKRNTSTAAVTSIVRLHTISGMMITANKVLSVFYDLSQSQEHFQRAQRLVFFQRYAKKSISAKILQGQTCTSLWPTVRKWYANWRYQWVNAAKETAELLITSNKVSIDSVTIDEMVGKRFEEKNIKYKQSLPVRAIYSFSHNTQVV